MVMAISQSTQNTWPPRAAVTVTGLTIGDVVAVSRVVTGGATTVLRGGSFITVGDTSLVLIDAELPFGVTVRYSVFNETTGTTALSDPATYGLTGGKVALTDAISGLSAEVTVAAWPERSFARPNTLFNVNGRIVTVAGSLGEQATEVEVWTESDTSSDSLMLLLTGATAATIQLRTPGGYSRMDTYLTVTSVVEKRRYQDGTKQQRSWVLTGVPSATGWPSNYLALGYTYLELDDVYTGLTYNDLKADYATYLDLAKADLS